MSLFNESFVDLGVQPHSAEQEIDRYPEPVSLQGHFPPPPATVADVPLASATHPGLEADMESMNDVANDVQSTTTSTIHRIMEHASAAVRGAAASSSLSAAELRHWDNQAAVGNIVICDHRFPIHINIMLYGESGLGKTTCIKNLIGMNGRWKIKREGAAFKAAAGSTGSAGKTSLQQFKADPDSLRIELEPVWDGRSNMELHFSFQDMPGWGDDINLVNSLKTVLEFLLQQRLIDYERDRAGQTEHDAVPGAKMRRAMTVCLYFIPPHRVKPIDYVMMAAISKLVAVLPVIAKADTFTQQEMDSFREELLKVLRHAVPAPDSVDPSVCFGGMASVLLEADQLGEGDIRDNLDSNITTHSNNNSSSSSTCSQDVDASVALASDLSLETYMFRAADLAAVGASSDRLPPFAIVASKDVLTSEQAAKVEREPGEPCRLYPWGPAFPYNRDHSDLIVLKQLLCGHRNAAIHDLLHDSWSHAHKFVIQLEQLALSQGNTLIGSSSMVGLKDPQISTILDLMVDEICSSACGTSQLRDKLRTEEQKSTLASLIAARARNDELERENQQLRAESGKQVEDLQHQDNKRQKAAQVHAEQLASRDRAIVIIALCAMFVAAVCFLLAMFIEAGHRSKASWW